MGVDLSPIFEVDETTTTGEPILAHIVSRKEDSRPAEALILEARVNGTAVEALCGHIWIPSRDPRNYPACQKCIEIYDFDKQFY